MMGLTVIFLWVPAHIGIKGNEMADKVAKEATNNNHIVLAVCFSKTEIKSIISCQSLKERWQKQWEEEKKG